MQLETPWPFVGRACFAPYDEIVFGPLASVGGTRSLGVNVTPPRCRVCSFDCIYCQLADEPRDGPGVRWPSPGEIGSALANSLPRVAPIDVIAISGRGEPTLHPHFGAVVAAVVAEAERARPRIRVRILTNGTGAVRPDVRRALDLLDERVVRLDAQMDRVNRPSERFPLGAVVSGLSLLRDVTIESCFVDGPDSNAGDEEVLDWADLVGELRPRRVEIYTAKPTRRHPELRSVAAERLDEIARVLWGRTRVAASILS